MQGTQTTVFLYAQPERIESTPLTPTMLNFVWENLTLVIKRDDWAAMVEMAKEQMGR